MQRGATNVHRVYATGTLKFNTQSTTIKQVGQSSKVKAHPPHPPGLWIWVRSVLVGLEDMFIYLFDK